jgi:ABC-type antimicrobial peptide transport system permease subunit
MAIGAERSHVLWLVMSEVLVLLAVGMAIALSCAWMLTQSVRSQLYGIEPLDPLLVALAAITIASVALAAGYVPARRAMRIDPTRALRYQ